MIDSHPEDTSDDRIDDVIVEGTNKMAFSMTVLLKATMTTMSSCVTMQQ